MNIDNKKRTTLKTIGVASAGALLSAIPIASLAKSVQSASPKPLKGAGVSTDLEVTLISSPDSVENSMVIKNVSSRRVSIDNFHANHVIFDGDIIDCNGSCKNGSIVLEPNQERVYPISQLDSHMTPTSPFEYLDAQATTDYLPRGTRVVNLGVSVSGNSGCLHQRV